MTEYDRTSPRVQFNLHRYTVARLKERADHGWTTVAELCADALRRGLYVYRLVEANRASGELPTIPAEDARPVKIRLYHDELARVEALARREFETTATMTAGLVRYGLRRP
jgi:hypothetical protein